MKVILLLLFLGLPTAGWTQSLGEVAKKEKERREQLKQQGRQVTVISDEELALQSPPPPPGDEEGEGGDESERSSADRPRPLPPRPSSGDDESSEEYMSEDEDVPTHIAPDLPLAERLTMFERMKRHYDAQVQEIDRQIAENNERIAELEAQIGATSALGGGGLPVAPQTGAGAATTQMTGQGTGQMVEEQNRLKQSNQQMEARKQTLKDNLISKGRVAGIPAGYLRF